MEYKVACKENIKEILKNLGVEEEYLYKDYLLSTAYICLTNLSN